MHETKVLVSSLESITVYGNRSFRPQWCCCIFAESRDELDVPGPSLAHVRRFVRPWKSPGDRHMSGIEPRRLPWRYLVNDAC